MRYLLTSIFCLPLWLFAQDTAWQEVVLTPDVTVQMPGMPLMRGFKAARSWRLDRDSVTYGAQYFPKAMFVHDPARLESTYRDFMKNYLHGAGMDGYSPICTDTGIDGNPGLMARLSGAQGEALRYGYAYITMDNGRLYAFNVIYRRVPQLSDDADRNRFFQSITLRGSNNPGEPKYVNRSGFFVPWKWIITGALVCCALFAGFGYLCYRLIKKSRR